MLLDGTVANDFRDWVISRRWLDSSRVRVSTNGEKCVGGSLQAMNDKPKTVDQSPTRPALVIHSLSLFSTPRVIYKEATPTPRPVWQTLK